MSEFGFQALPPLKTIATYADPADWNMTSYIMEHHQRSWVGNGLMIAQMTDTFRMAKDFPSLVYLSLILQAEGIRYGVEHWRRNRDRVSGTLIWQLNDCWPATSWAIVDYALRPKPAYYLVRRALAPLAVGLVRTADGAAVWAMNGTLAPVEAELVLQTFALDGAQGRPVGTGRIGRRDGLVAAGPGIDQEQVGQPAELDGPEDAARVRRIRWPDRQPLGPGAERVGLAPAPGPVAGLVVLLGAVAPGAVGELVVVERADERVDGVDRLDVTALASVDDFTDVQAVAVQLGAAVVMNFDEGRLTLLNTQLVDVTADDFLF